MLSTEVLEKTLEVLLDHKEIQPVNPKGNQSCIFIGRTDVEAETSILWPPDAKRLKKKKVKFLHGIFQARVLEWIAISFSRGSSQPRD